MLPSGPHLRLQPSAIFQRRYTTDDPEDIRQRRRHRSSVETLVYDACPYIERTLTNKAVSNPSKRQRLSPKDKDVLPSFSSLTNDDDREKKAEFKPLGTYNVVVNPASFVQLEEYRETFPEDPYPPPPSSSGGPPAKEVRPITRPDSPLDSFDIATGVDVSSIASLDILAHTPNIFLATVKSLKLHTCQ